MEYFEKIKTVRENIEQWLKYWNGHDGFSYHLCDFIVENEKTGESSVYIGKGEHSEILNYLASRNEIEIVENKAGSVILIVPAKLNPIIRLRTLELLSKELKDYYTGQNIIDLLKDNGADQRLITYPESKWKIFYKVFSELSVSQNKNDWELLFKIISEVLHPVNLGGDIKKSRELEEKYNNILKYDGFVIKDLKITKINEKSDKIEHDLSGNQEEIYSQIEKEKTKLEVIEFILDKYNKEHTIDLYLSRSDAPIETGIKKNVLKELGIKYEIILKSPPFDPPKKPSKLEQERHPEWILEYEKELEEYNLIYDDDPYSVAIIKKDDIDVSSLREEMLKLKENININDKYKESLFYLRLYYMKLLDLLEVVGGSPVGYRDQSLNAFYILLQDKIQKLLNQNFFSSLNKSAPEMYDNLLGNVDDVIDSWEYLSCDLYNFFGQIEKQFILSEVPDFEIPEDLKKSFEHIDGKIAEYKKTVDQQFARMMENAKRNADEMMGNSQNNSTNNKQELSIKISEMPELKIQGVGNQKEADDITKINLSDNSISFDDDKVKIIIGKKECQLPPFKNEHYFCRAIFQHPVNEFVDWSIIFENMDKTLNSGSKKDSTKNKRSVWDTINNLNNRIKEVINTDDDLFTWKDKTVKRNH